VQGKARVHGRPFTDKAKSRDPKRGERRPIGRKRFSKKPKARELATQAELYEAEVAESLPLRHEPLAIAQR
jgi:hypothetical protein